MHKLIALGTAALVMASCSVLNGRSHVVRASRAERDVREHASHTPSAPVAPGHVPADALACNGEWTIVEVGGQQVRSDEMPYVNFASDKGRFYASNGCNILNGEFTFKGHTVTFDNVLSTMRLCPDYKTEQAINAVLGNGKTFTAHINDEADESFMLLSDTSGNTAMKLRRHNLDRLNGLWIVNEIASAEVDIDGVDIFIDIPEMNVHGNTGCNYFNGRIEFNPEQSRSIAFSDMAVTMKACANSETERRMLVAMEETSSYSLESDTLTLLSRSGEPLMRLHR